MLNFSKVFFVFLLFFSLLSCANEDKKANERFTKRFTPEGNYLVLNKQKTKESSEVNLKSVKIEESEQDIPRQNILSRKIELESENKSGAKNILPVDIIKKEVIDLTDVSLDQSISSTRSNIIFEKQDMYYDKLDGRIELDKPKNEKNSDNRIIFFGKFNDQTEVNQVSKIFFNGKENALDVEEIENQYHVYSKIIPKKEAYKIANLAVKKGFYETEVKIG